MFEFVLAIDNNVGWPWVLEVAMVEPTWLSSASICEGEWGGLLSGWSCAAIAVVVYLQFMVSPWASWKAGGCSPGLLSHRHSLHRRRRGCASFA